MKTTSMRLLGIAILFGALGALAAPAFAGGPNNLFDAHDPYVWKMDHWPGGAVPVYTDLGGFGLLNNAQANGWTVGAFDQWNNVPSSTFRAQVVGSVALLGLTDITPANAAQVYPGANGGGITVVYDFDGHIFTDYFGLPRSVLGVTFLEAAVPGTDEIFEASVFLNGFDMFFNDTTGAGFSGVFTHEFGHSLNLRHTQVNGAVQSRNTQDWPMPYGCTSGQPYSGGMGVGPDVTQVETMFPFADQRPGGTAQYEFTVDKMDDIQAISDLYPAPGWPESHGTIKGTVNYLTKILGNGTGPTQQITGVNMIARNIADPYNDFVSITTGEYTRGNLGPDGSYELHGLTPGATYVVYTDNFLLGAFPVPRILTLPGPEEWWNGALESGDGTTDDRCAWTGIPASPGSIATANITFNKVHGAPVVTIPSFPGTVTDITGDGSLMVGITDGSEDYWTWTGDGNPTFQTTGGAAHFGGNPSISDDGTKIAGQVYDASGVAHWGIFQNGAWTVVPPPPTTPPGGGPCSDSNGKRWGLLMDISGDGLTLVGQANTRQCLAAGIRAATWTAAAGWTILAKDPAAPTTNSRAQGANYDGSVITGFDNRFSQNRGVYWSGGVEHFFDPTPQTIDPGGFFGQGFQVSRDGQIIYGQQYFDTSCTTSLCAAYLYHVSTGEYDVLNAQNDPSGTGFSAAYRGSDDGSVITGWDQVLGDRFPKVWTRELGWFSLETFLNAQGTYFPDLKPFNATAISATGQVWGGALQSIQGPVPVRYDVPKAIVCHKSPGNPNGIPQNLAVTFPGGLDEHLAHGDTVGLCQIGGN